MPNYRVTFVKNEIIKCTETRENMLNQETGIHYEHKNGQLILALIKAPTKEKARTIAKKLAKELMVAKQKSKQGL